MHVFIFTHIYICVGVGVDVLLKISDADLSHAHLNNPGYRRDRTGHLLTSCMYFYPEYMTGKRRIEAEQAE